MSEQTPEQKQLFKDVADMVALTTYGNSFNNIDDDKRGRIAFAVADMVQYIDQHTKEQITNVLNNLTVVVKENALRYAPSDTFGEVLNAIAEERKKLL